jgi:2'-5' RNA ligase
LKIYEQLWAEAMSAFESGAPQVDPHLTNLEKDFRRGVTLAFRPSPAVLEKANPFLNQLVAVAPGQYFYRPEQVHVTILSIISGTELWRQEIRRLADCRAIINEVLRRQRPFKICFRGVTASPNAVMIQGFPAGDGLNQLRDELRQAFAQNGLGGQLDRRYKTTSAHMTVMRFSRLETDWQQLAALLAKNRTRNFGEIKVNRIQLIWGDWYASAKTVRILQEYHLPDTAD